jgi:hypothetical protein
MTMHQTRCEGIVGGQTPAGGSPVQRRRAVANALPATVARSKEIEERRNFSRNLEPALGLEPRTC